jgi:hypothetical protein
MYIMTTSINKRYILSLLSVLVLFASCDKWLEEKPRSIITTNQFYRTSEDAESAVNAIYTYLYPPYARFAYDDMPYSMLELPTGQFRDASQSALSREIYNLRYSATDPFVARHFESYYRGIEAANLAVANIPKITMNETLKARILGEARFLRAYYYYNLANIFGPVPIKLKPTEKPQDALLPKSTVKEIYETVIIPDLMEAEKSGLPATPAGTGRVSMGAVKSLMAKAYLSMAGFPVNQPDKFALAKAKAGEVISSGAFRLFQSDASLTWFNKLNNPDFDNKEEHIFSINYGENQRNNDIPSYLLPKEALFTTFLQFGGMYPEDAFLNSYDAADLRGKNNQGFFFNRITIGNTTHNFPWSVYKFYHPSLVTKSPASGKDFPVIRYAEVLLMYAEAQNEADGAPNAAGYDALNAIRVRAGLSPVSGLSKEAFREEVWRQRYWELVGEHVTWFDMVRTRKAFNATTKTFVNLVGHTMPSGAVFKQENLYFPIPDREVQINPLLK